MSDNPLKNLTKFGQSFWYDNIQRKMLIDGQLQKLIDEDGLRGITSNPAIFEKAIANSSDYDASLNKFIQQQPDANSRYAFFHLAIEDIQQAADKLRAVYDTTKALDGYVSLEVSPDIANDTDASIKEAQDLFLRLQRPNA
ncbi:MAG: transaldolase family protein, partial [Gammaproteobacteria bacterium]|nr:transaldolase family protein [Gammaproteobacteria bacterium]